MTDRPILFSAPMIRALLDGRKSQTRRIIPAGNIYCDISSESAEDFELRGWDIRTHGDAMLAVKLRIAASDRLWVREAHALVPSSAYRMSDGVRQAVNPSDKHEAAVYRCDWERSAPPWRPSIHMPRWASRLTLTVTDVRVRRLHDISEEDARAEGVECDSDGWRDYLMPATQCCASATDSYRTLWDSINGAGSWAANPWCAAYTFTVERRNIDASSSHGGQPDV